MDMTLTKDKILTQLISTSINIKNIYDNINVINEQALSKTLKLELAKEDLYYDLLGINKKNYKEILKFYEMNLKYNYLQEIQKNNSKERKIELLKRNKLLEERFRNYLTSKFEYNMTPSKHNEPKTKYNRDINKISHKAKSDFYLSYLRFINKRTVKAKTIDEANLCLRIKSKVLFLYKELEKKEQRHDYRINDIDKYVDLGFNKEIVYDIYNSFISEKVNRQNEMCYQYTDETLKNSTELNFFHTNIDLLKAGLYMMNKEDLIDTVNNYKDAYKNKDKECVNEIINAMDEVVTLKNRIRKQKKK